MYRRRSTRTLSVETLDDRIVPSGTGITSLPIATQEAFVTERAGQALGTIFTQYENYEAAGASGTFSSNESNQIYLSGTSVGVDVNFGGGNYNTLLGQLKSIGMNVTATSTLDSLVEGYLPIANLPIVASNGYVSSIAPVYKPESYATVPTVTGSTASDEALVSNKGGEALGSIYTQYVNDEQAGSSATFTSSFSNQIYISGTSVGVDVRFNGGNLNTLVSQLEEVGMQVTAISAQDEIVEGYLPIANLPVVASNGYVSSLSPVYKPASY